jgi:hypothetical protein
MFPKYFKRALAQSFLPLISLVVANSTAALDIVGLKNDVTTQPI